MPQEIRFSETRLKAVQPVGRTQSPSALLTYPIRDVDGDYLHPAGCRIHTQEVTGTQDVPGAVNWTHLTPIGRGTVTMQSVPVDGVPTIIPVGKTKFFERAQDLIGLDLARYDVGSDARKSKRPTGRWTEKQCLQAAAEVHELVAADIASGVSVEFVTLKARQTGHVSPYTQLPSMDVMEWDLRTWAHCSHPRNPGALTVENDMDLITKSIRLAETGKLPSGKPIQSDVILKAFSPFAQIKRNPIVAVPAQIVEVKAMEDEVEDAGIFAAPGDAPPGDVNGDGLVNEADDELDDEMMGDDDTPPTAKASYDLAQGVMDLCATGEEALKKAEHVKGRDKLKKIIEELRTYADDLTAVGEMVEADLKGGDKPDIDAGEVDTEGEPDGDADEDDLPEPVMTTKSGRIKVKSGYKPRRFKMSELKPIAAATPAPAVPSPDEEAQVKAISRKLARLQRDIAVKLKLANLPANQR